MSWRKFKFISPGIFVNEIDNSQLPQVPGAVGPVVIGRTAQGPGLKPIRVNSFSEFIQTFGNPIKGGAAGDVWRDGFINAPTYAAYAAQAWLRNNTPITVVRLLGKANANAETSGYAGWKTDNTALSTTAANNGGAFGLFLVEGTGTVATDGVIQTGDDLTIGTLAAVWYIQAGSVELSGNNVAASPVAVTGTCQYIKAVDSNLTFKALVKDGSGNVQIDAPFDFTPSSGRFIRKVFNTNPTLTNSDITTAPSRVKYWLGESYEGSVANIPLSSTVQGSITGLSGTSTSDCYGIILPLGVPDNSLNGGDFLVDSSKDLNAATGWFFSQDMGATASFQPENLQKLFRLVGRDYGEDIQKRVKVSIRDIKTSTDPYNQFGSFSVVLRDMKDTDRTPRIIEQYNNCNLNPGSDNYVARKIGNTYYEWSDTDNRYTEYGDYPNQSDYVRVEMNRDVDGGGTNPVFLPFGVVGAPRYIGFANSGSDGYTYTLGSAMVGATGPFATSGSQVGNTGGDFVTGSDVGSRCVAAKFKFPELRLRQSSSEGGLSDPKNAYFGVDTTYNGAKFNESVVDLLRTKADSIPGQAPDSSYTEAMWYFSLDDVRNSEVTTAGDSQDTNTPNAVYASGSRVDGISYTAHTESGGTYATASYTNVLDAGWNQFTTCLHGGASGMDITEREPFNNTRALSSDKNANTSYAFNAVSVAINSIADAERTEMNMACMPGITNNDLNRRLADVCEDRGDALAILDLQGGYTPNTENSTAQSSRQGSVDSTVDNLQDTLKLNNSYACAYYPWVQIRDTINGGALWAPPSVVALGAISYGQATSQLWFAPAGFTRGGLTANNAAGVPVINVKEKLTSKQRDKLYDANVNPIASFPAEGIVIFGQKTLQVTPSALDRINVRRLLIHLKREISRMAATVLFDQNVESTWARFTSVAEPFLRTVKAGLGITDYRLILDSTTTTPDLIDRNIMYAKIIIKPARAIEFIAIDFVITDSGAAFED